MIDRNGRAHTGHIPCPAFLVLLLFGLVLLAPASSARAGTVTWATGYPGTVSTPTTLPLGGGSTVDVTVTTGGTQGLANANLLAAGATESGLAYTELRTLAIFNGGGTGSVPTTVTFSNFVAGPNHVRGFIVVGALDELSSAVTATSSVGGAVQGWTQVGTDFDLSLGNTDPISWTPASGQFATPGPDNGIDSGGLIVEIGSIAQYGTITLSLSQHLADGIYFGIGEESATAVPAASGGMLALTSLLLMAAAGLFVRRPPTSTQT